MTRSRGEPSRGLIDGQWTHQVALPMELCTGQNYERPHAFCRDLGGYYLRPSVNDGYRQYLVFCFAEPQDPIQFRQAFNGIAFYPEDRKRKTWKRPLGDARRPPKRNPYEWK